MSTGARWPVPARKSGDEERCGVCAIVLAVDSAGNAAENLSSTLSALQRNGGRLMRNIAGLQVTPDRNWRSSERHQVLNTESGTMPIRQDWMFDVRSKCQSFLCLLLDADRTQFEAALMWLLHAVPIATSIQEIDALTDRLQICAIDAGTRFHRNYHRRTRRTPCGGSAVESAMHVWTTRGRDPRVTLERWITEFLAAFDRTHPTSPAERAAAILRTRFRTPPSFDALADEVGASRSRLARDFRRRYKMTSGEYVTRLRLAWFIDEVRRPGAIATLVSQDVGYESYHNLLSALNVVRV